MKSLFLLFSRLVVRTLLREPGRTALTAFAVALGVAVVIAINMAGQAAAGSFHSSLESLAGKADLVISQVGGLDERLLGRLVQLPYDFRFTPRIEDFASIDGKGEARAVIGLDLIGQSNIKDSGDRGMQTSSRELDTGNPIWVGARLGLHAGEHVQLLIDDRMREFVVKAILKTNAADISEENAIVTDIGIAQSVTGKIGRLDRIEVTVPASQSIEYWRGMLRQNLPPSCTIDGQGARTDENRKMLSAFRWNLNALSYIALIVGAFLIYNTISISVVRRRNEIGVLRALGAPRGMITAGFLAEAMFLSFWGSLVGLALGRLMAQGAVKMVGTTVKSLYISSQPGAVAFTPQTVLIGMGLGMGMSLLAAFAPAVEAARVPPVEAMARGREEYVAGTRSRPALILAAIALATAAALSQLPSVHGQPIYAYAASMLLVVGVSAVIPSIVTLFAATAQGIAGRLFGVEAALALRSLRASLSRTSVLTAALATAVAMMASVGIMVGSFRETVWLWMNSQLEADYYMRPAGSVGADRHPTMGGAIADKIVRLPGVSAVDRFRDYPISYEGAPATLGGGETSAIEKYSTTRFLPGENRSKILAKLPTGDYAVISEPFANRHNVGVGSTVALTLPRGTVRFQVLGIYYDYSTERGYVVLDRRTLLKYLPDPALSSLAVFLKSGADADKVRAEIDGAIAGRAITVIKNSMLREAAIAVFDRTFRITYALEAVAVIVAVLGIAGALLAMVIDRRREFALLRFLGAAQPQIRRIILSEAGLLGLLANGVGLVLGTLLSLILVFVINKQSFGWTIQFHWPVALLLIALTGVYVATVLAGFYPARVATQMNPIEVIHEE